MHSVPQIIDHPPAVVNPRPLSVVTVYFPTKGFNGSRLMTPICILVTMSRHHPREHTPSCVAAKRSGFKLTLERDSWQKDSLRLATVSISVLAGPHG